MRARSALFDVYGDHLRSRGDQAPVSALIRLLEPVGIAAPAVRTAISRMSAQGWLEPARVDAAPGYRATRRAIERLTEAASRIYRSGPEPWDGRWRLVFVDLPRERGERERLREELHYLGLRRARPGRVAVPVRAARGRRGGRPGPAGRPGTRSPSSSPPTRSAPGTWPGSPRRTPPGRRSRTAGPRRRRTHPSDEDESAFAARFRLVHEWRKFLFDDPGLPGGAAAPRLARAGGGRPVHQRGGPAQAGLRPLRGPLPGTAGCESLRA